MDNLTIPKEKIKNQRFGQFLINALTSYRKGIAPTNDVWLFIDNETLQEAVNEYLVALEKKLEKGGKSG